MDLFSRVAIAALALSIILGSYWVSAAIQTNGRYEIKSLGDTAKILLDKNTGETWVSSAEGKTPRIDWRPVETLNGVKGRQSIYLIDRNLQVNFPKDFTQEQIDEAISKYYEAVAQQEQQVRQQQQQQGQAAPQQQAPAVAEEPEKK